MEKPERQVNINSSANIGLRYRRGGFRFAKDRVESLNVIAAVVSTRLSHYVFPLLPF